MSRNLNAADLNVDNILPEYPVKNLSNIKFCNGTTYCADSSLIQKRIYDMQNPSLEECAKAKFLIYSPLNIGIGATIHLVADAMTVAINTGRILYIATGGSTWAPSTCEEGTMRCYFEPITSCPID